MAESSGSEHWEHDHEHMAEAHGQNLQEQAEDHLKELLGQMPHEVSLHLFVSDLKNNPYDQYAKQLLEAADQLSPKIMVRTHDLKSKLAREWDITVSPTLAVDPERYQVRWRGAPLGQESQVLVESFLMMGFAKSDISPQSAKVLAKLNGPRELKVFVSPTCPYCPQQAVNALKAVVERPDLVSLEIIDIQVNPDLAEQYHAHSTPQVFANDVLIAKGAQPEELFMASIKELEQQTVFIPSDDAQEVKCDLVIIGGGPAGLTAAIYGARAGLDSVVIEKGVLGGQVATTPVVENYPGLTQVGGKALVDIMVNHALQYGKIYPAEEVMEVTTGDPMVITTNRRRFTARALLLATGASHRRLGVPGEDRLSGLGVSYCSTCDGPLFKGNKVLMAGGGDSAVTEALHLKNIGVDVTLVHRREKLRAQEQLVGQLEANQIPVLFNTEIKEIRGQGKVEEVELYNNQSGKSEVMAVDGVFVAIGYEPQVELATKLGVELTPEHYIKIDAKHRTNVPGVYAAGDVQGGYKQIVTAAGQGSEAALSIFEDLVSPYWTKGESSK